MLRPASRFVTLLVVTLVTLCAGIPCAAEDDESLGGTISQLADSEAEVRSAAVETLTQVRDPRILAVLEHYKKRALLLWKGELVLCPEMKTDDDGNRVAPRQDVLSGEPLLDEDGKPRVVLKSETTEVLVRRPERRALEDAIRVHELFAADPDRRLAAVPGGRAGQRRPHASSGAGVGAPHYVCGELGLCAGGAEGPEAA